MQFASLADHFGRIRCLLALLLLAGLACAHPLLLAQEQNLELEVKAAYLYKFAGYVEWPEGSFVRADSPLVIGVLASDALADQLERTVAGHTASGHPLQVRKLKKGDAPGNVHILFLGALDRTSLQDILSATRSQPLLTVSDSEEAYAMGSMINFVLADDRLRFVVALKPAASARLRISARMLAAAYRVLPGAI